MKDVAIDHLKEWEWLRERIWYVKEFRKPQR